MAALEPVLWARFGTRSPPLIPLPPGGVISRSGFSGERHANGGAEPTQDRASADELVRSIMPPIRRAESALTALTKRFLLWINTKNFSLGGQQTVRQLCREPQARNSQLVTRLAFVQLLTASFRCTRLIIEPLPSTVYQPVNFLIETT
jgi:hypothetical protein